MTSPNNSLSINVKNMKIARVLAWTLPLLIVGCKHETTLPANAAFPSSRFPSAKESELIRSNEPDTLPEKQRTAVAGWDRVKISGAGEIFVNKKQMTLAEFATECQRLKQLGLGAVIYMDAAPPSVIRPAQTNAAFTLIDARVGMLLVSKESQLD